MEDTDVISQIREGMTGIFMPMEYFSEDVYQMNDSVLVLRDIAEYGLRDGMRFTILETENGLAYDGAFEGLNGDSSLEEAKDYIKDLIK